MGLPITSLPEHNAAPLPAARWTLGDMLLVALGGLIAGAALLLLLRAPELLGLSGLRELIRAQRLAAGMLIGGLIYGSLLLMVGLVVVHRRGVSWAEVGFRRPPLLPLLLTPVLFGAQMLLQLATTLLTFAIFGQRENPQTAALLDPRGFSWLNFTLVLLVAAVVAPIVEEVLFRGLLYQWLRTRGGVPLAVVASAAIFAVAHVIPVLIPPLFVVGLVLALVFEWSHSLWVTITLHALQNGLAVVVLFVAQAYNLLPAT